MLDKEIARIKELGVEIFCNEEVHDLSKLRGDFDAVIIATGYPKAKTLSLFDGNSRCATAVEYLKKVKTCSGKLPKHLVCIGGGDVDMDVCTTAKKLGVQQVTDVVYETFAEFKVSKVNWIWRESTVSPSMTGLSPFRPNVVEL